MPQGITAVPPMVPKEEPGSERIDPMHLNLADHKVNQDTGGM